jgi:O-antigen/teichoic acid export membrane protein
VLVRRGSQQPELLSRLYSGTLTWQTLIALPVFSVTLLVHVVLGTAATGVLVLAIVLLASVPEIWSFTARAAAGALQRQAGVSAALVTQRLITTAAVLVALLTGAGVVGLALAFLVGTAVGWGAHTYTLGRAGIRFQTAGLTRAGLLELIRGTALIGLSEVVLVALFRVDVVILGGIDGPVALAVYAVAYRLLETVLFIAHAVAGAIMPVLSATTDSGAVAAGLERGYAVVAFTYVPFMVASVMRGDEVIALLFGSSYGAASGSVLAWLSPAPLLFAMAYLGTSALLSRDRPRQVLAAAIAATAANVALNVVLIPRLSARGAAIATTLSFAVQLVWVIASVWTVSGPFKFVRPLVESVLAGLVLAAGLLLLDLHVAFDLGIGGVLYVVAWLLLVARFAPEQVAVVRSLVGRARP